MKLLSRRLSQAKVTRSRGRHWNEESGSLCTRAVVLFLLEPWRDMSTYPRLGPDFFSPVAHAYTSMQPSAGGVVNGGRARESGAAV